MVMQISMGEKGKKLDALRGRAWAFNACDKLCHSFTWLFDRIQSTRRDVGSRRQMHLVESLALGNRRQLLLVVCDNQRYLVGAGADSVGSILAVESGAGLEQGAMPTSAMGASPHTHSAPGPKLVRESVRQPSSQKDKSNGSLR